MTGEPSRAKLLEISFPVLLIVFASGYIWASFEVPEPPRNIVVGPRTFPILVGGMMLASAAALLWFGLRRAGPGADVGIIPSEEDPERITDWPAVWFVLSALLTLFLFFDQLGFLVGIASFLFVLSTFFAPRRLVRNALSAVGFSVIFSYLFTEILGIPLPMGLLAFEGAE